MDTTPHLKIQSRKTYRHLNLSSREEIAVMRAKGNTLREIGEAIGFNASSVCRELRRNVSLINKTEYRACIAEKKTKARQKLAYARERIADPTLRKKVIEDLSQDLSPEIISGRLKMEGSELKISHETIYQFIYKSERHLIKFLAFAHKTRRKRGSAKNKRAVKIPNRVMILERPEVVDQRQRTGDWEGDTAVCRESTYVLTVNTERRSRLVRITKVKSKSKKLVCAAMVKNITSVPGVPCHTLTLDNGTENCDHEKITQRTGAKVFFCNPYHSWEKGCVEQTIGLIRRYLPKRTDFSKISEAIIARIEYMLNNRPRKCLGYKTPNEFVALAS
jgi:IS30 family transposase